MNPKFILIAVAILALVSFSKGDKELDLPEECPDYDTIDGFDLSKVN
jgi:hypothetical protein